MRKGFGHYSIDQFLRQLEPSLPNESDPHTDECDECRLVEALVRRVWGRPSDEDSEVLVDRLRAR